MSARSFLGGLVVVVLAAALVSPSTAGDPVQGGPASAAPITRVIQLEMTVARDGGGADLTGTTGLGSPPTLPRECQDTFGDGSCFCIVAESGGCAGVQGSCWAPFSNPCKKPTT